jgi:lambda family phage portal protein
MKSNLIDSLVDYFSPSAGLRRQRARLAQSFLAEHARKYEGASSGRRTDGWKARQVTSVNAEIGPALHLVRERSRDLVRNDPYATRAVAGITANVIGTGIMYDMAGEGTSARKLANAKAIWRDWSESTDCDADGLHDFYGLQSLAQRTVTEGGEALLVRKWRRKRDGYDIPVPFQVQVLEGDYIDTAKNADLSDGGFILQGVEFDSKGRRVAYWLFPKHPGEQLLTFGKGFTSQRTLASDVKHLFRVDRAGQVRGMPWGAPCIIRLRDFDEYEDFVALRMKIAACFTAFVGDIEAPAEGETTTKAFAEKLEPGAIEILPPARRSRSRTCPPCKTTGTPFGRSARSRWALASPTRCSRATYRT